MTSIRNEEQIRNKASEIKVSPPDASWAKIQTKLANQSKGEKIRFYRKLKTSLNIAASIAIIVAAGSVIYYETQSTDLISRRGTIASWENLDYQVDDYLNIENVRSLSEAYKRVSLQ